MREDEGFVPSRGPGSSEGALLAGYKFHIIYIMSVLLNVCSAESFSHRL